MSMKKKPLTDQDFRDRIIAKIRHHCETEYGPLCAEDERDLAVSLTEIREALEGLSRDALFSLVDVIFTSYSVDCECERYRVEIDARTGDVKIINLAENP